MRIFTPTSHDRFAIVTKDAPLQGNLTAMDGQGATTESFAKVCRGDLHCHSTASQESKLGVQRAAGLPECATPPQEVYELAKRRDMDLVTITDHDTIAGVLEIADRPDVFVSELTASPQLRGRLARGGLAAVQERTWERALQRLGDGYRKLLTANDSLRVARAA